VWVWLNVGGCGQVWTVVVEHAGADFSLVGYCGRKTYVPKNKLALLNKERRGYISPKEISVNGTKLKVHEAELVIKEHENKNSAYQARSNVRLFDEFPWLSFELLLAGYAAKIIRLTIIRLLELRRPLIHDSATNRISMHNIPLNHMQTCSTNLLSLMVRKNIENNAGNRSHVAFSLLPITTNLDSLSILLYKSRGISVDEKFSFIL